MGCDEAMGSGLIEATWLQRRAGRNRFPARIGGWAARRAKAQRTGTAPALMIAPRCYIVQTSLLLSAPRARLTVPARVSPSKARRGAPSQPVCGAGFVRQARSRHAFVAMARSVLR